MRTNPVASGQQMAQLLQRHREESNQLDEAAGRANYEAFFAKMQGRMPAGYPLGWDAEAQDIRDAWIAGAKAAKTHIALRRMTSSPAGLDQDEASGAGSV